MRHPFSCTDGNHDSVVLRTNVSDDQIKMNGAVPEDEIAVEAGIRRGASDVNA